MDTLLGKLTQLTYEFFGVLLPGFLGSVFLVLIWFAIGPLAETWSLGYLAELQPADVAHLDASLSSSMRLAVLALLAVSWYLLGQVLNGFSRSRTTPKSLSLNSVFRLTVFV